MPSNNTENAIALGVVVVANWLLSHVATSWVMPPEVQSSVQATIIAIFGAYLQYRRQSAAAPAPVAPQGAPAAPASPAP